ncbi:dual specificity tyrosine-phosphorylation-regulated kinase [Acrasis kona]|uniref:Dual specificity tyrosine-phosphorylation-regulated kinase n=1 Tax=Acrasis kona TaxID=1008807 RepID=A0AAW2ZCE8_9EUKA
MNKHEISVLSSDVDKILSNAKIPYTTFNFSLIDNGVYNPVYKIEVEHMGEITNLILKITNPKWKFDKTTNESAIIDFLSKHTNIPAPKLYSFDNTGTVFGHEFILMQQIPGIPLSDIYSELDFDQRKPYLDQLAKIFADIQKININVGSQTFGCFSRISPVSNKPHHFTADMIPNVYNKMGPYDNYVDYQISMIECHLEDLLNSKFASFVERFEKYIQIINKKKQNKNESLKLVHLDLAPKNIMVDSLNKNITGIIDWEWGMLSVFDEDWRKFLEIFPSIGELRRLEPGSEEQDNNTIKNKALWKGEQERLYVLNCIKELINVPDQELYESRRDDFYVARYSLNMALCSGWYDNPEQLNQYELLLRKKTDQLLNKYGI